MGPGSERVSDPLQSELDKFQAPNWTTPTQTSGREVKRELHATDVAVAVKRGSLPEHVARNPAHPHRPKFAPRGVRLVERVPTSPGLPIVRFISAARKKYLQSTQKSDNIVLLTFGEANVEPLIVEIDKVA